jgi:hypothetical protein
MRSYCGDFPPLDTVVCSVQLAVRSSLSPLALLKVNPFGFEACLCQVAPEMYPFGLNLNSKCETKYLSPI